LRRPSRFAASTATALEKIVQRPGVSAFARTLIGGTLILARIISRQILIWRSAPVGAKSIASIFQGSGNAVSVPPSRATESLHSGRDQTTRGRTANPARGSATGRNSATATARRNGRRAICAHAALNKRHAGTTQSGDAAHSAT